MVRRRCRIVLVSDAGYDPDFKFEDLGNAVRKIEIDFGIPIRLDKLEALRGRSQKSLKASSTKDGLAAPSEVRHVIGTIDYKAVDPNCENGTLIYIKPCYYGIEGAAIRSYAMAHLDFPHQSTANQWFTESQFEAYRSLGFETMDRILAGASSKACGHPSLAGLCAATIPES